MEQTGFHPAVDGARADACPRGGLFLRNPLNRRRTLIAPDLGQVRTSANDHQTGLDGDLYSASPFHRAPLDFWFVCPALGGRFHSTQGNAAQLAAEDTQGALRKSLRNGEEFLRKFLGEV